MAKEMGKRVELELRGRKPSEIAELNCDNCKAENGQVTAITDAFTGLEILSLINCEISSLKDFPKLPELRKLELSDNKLVGGLEHLKGCPNITNLNMSGNLFKDAKAIEPLKDLPNLKTLDLFNCPLTEEDSYRQDVFKLVPHLVYLDGFDREDREIEDSDFEGLDEHDLDDEHEGDEVGLSYLNDSKCLNDDDEGNDFAPDATGNGTLDDDDIDDEEEEEPEDESSQDSTARQTRKRKHQGDTEEDESSQDG